MVNIENRQPPISERKAVVLSPKELTIVQQVVNGKSFKEIGQDFNEIERTMARKIKKITHQFGKQETHQMVPLLIESGAVKIVPLAHKELTQQENRIMDLIREGNPNHLQMISQTLFKEECTIKKNLWKIYKKLSANNLNQALAQYVSKNPHRQPETNNTIIVVSEDEQHPLDPDDVTTIESILQGDKKNIKGIKETSRLHIGTLERAKTLVVGLREGGPIVLPEKKENQIPNRLLTDDDRKACIILYADWTKPPEYTIFDPGVKHDVLDNTEVTFAENFFTKVDKPK